MRKARITLDASFVHGDIDPRLSGSFVEHLGRCVYGGIFEPGHPEADQSGFRRDVLDLVRDLGVPIVRYPGGNFVSSYRWEDGVGPIAERPVRLDLSWHSIETNAFGLGEFVEWCRVAGAEPMVAINLGTRGVDAACELLEYANFSKGTKWSDLRVEHRAAEPYDVRVWCLGNELDGRWQIGHKTAEEYGRLAAETARAMRRIDSNLELVACGSSGSWMPTYPDWEATVLDLCYDDVDFLSLHSYFEPNPEDVGSFLASALKMDEFIEAVVGTCDFARARKRSKKVMNLAFDEWNVWYPKERWTEGHETWRVAPHLFEDTYDIADAVVVGSLLNSLLRHADRVRIACVAQLVNVIAPIHTRDGGGAWRETTYYPMRDVAHFAKGQSLVVHLEGPEYDNPGLGSIPVLDVAASSDVESGALTIFVANRSLEDSVDLELDVRGVGELVPVEHSVLADSGPYVAGVAVNTEEQPGRVTPRSVPLEREGVQDSRVVIAPLSWNVIRFVSKLGPR